MKRIGETPGSTPAPPRYSGASVEFALPLVLLRHADDYAVGANSTRRAQTTAQCPAMFG